MATTCRCSRELETDLPGLWKAVTCADAYARKTVDHLLHCGLIGEVKHDGR